MTQTSSSNLARGEIRRQVKRLGREGEPQIILKTDERNLVLELGARGNRRQVKQLG